MTKPWDFQPKEYTPIQRKAYQDKIQQLVQQLGADPQECFKLAIVELPLQINVKVVIVDGGYVRNNIPGGLEFISGGHGYVYDFIPKDEIWMDDDNPEDEFIYDLMHEFYERSLMKEGYEYNAAHDKASEFELIARKDPSKALSQLLLAMKKNVENPK
jgi:hypothetical protein